MQGGGRRPRQEVARSIPEEESPAAGRRPRAFNEEQKISRLRGKVGKTVGVSSTPPHRSQGPGRPEKCGVGRLRLAPVRRAPPRPGKAVDRVALLEGIYRGRADHRCQARPAPPYRPRALAAPASEGGGAPRSTR